MTQVALCPVSDITDGMSKGFELANSRSVFVVGDDGAVFVYLNECPHLGVNLEWEEDKFLDSEGRLIECSTHGALFEMDTGQCIVGPCQGESLTAIPFEIVDGHITVDASRI
jgi:nitrite reductase/ring-hydroxylating ferredoxin subunit